MSNIEDTLWEHLVEHHGADRTQVRSATRSRAPRRPVVIGTAVTSFAAAAGAAVLLLSATTNAPPAYALTKNADGSITVTIHDLEAAVPALNARFAAMGVSERVVPVEANCPISNPALSDAMMAYPQATTTETVTLGTNIDPGYTGVVAAEQLPNGEVAMVVESIKPPVPSCFPATAYTLENTGRTINRTPIYQFTPVNVAPTPTTAPTSTAATAPTSTTGG